MGRASVKAIKPFVVYDLPKYEMPWLFCRSKTETRLNIYFSELSSFQIGLHAKLDYSRQQNYLNLKTDKQENKNRHKQKKNNLTSLGQIKNVRDGQFLRPNCKTFAQLQL